MYYYILFALVIIGICIYYYYKKTSIEGFADLSGVIVDLSGNPLRDPDGNILLITQEHVDYIQKESQTPLTPIQQEIVNNYQQSPDNRPLTDSNRQCDMLKQQYNSMNDTIQHYRQAGDWTTYRKTLSSLSTIQSKMSELGC
jgi:hypothetical protein